MTSLIGFEAIFILKNMMKIKFLDTLMLLFCQHDVKNQIYLDVFASGSKAHSSHWWLVWKPGDWLSNNNSLPLIYYHCYHRESQLLCTVQPKFYNGVCFCSGSKSIPCMFLFHGIFLTFTEELQRSVDMSQAGFWITV